MKVVKTIKTYIAQSIFFPKFMLFMR